MSQVDLAAELNRLSGWDTITRQYVSRWESDKRRPRTELRRHLAQALGVSVSDLTDMNRRTLLAAALPLFDAAHVAPIREALHAVDAVTGIYGQPTSGPASISQIERDTAAMCACFQQSRYAELVSRLPNLLADAQLAARTAEGSDRDRARAAMSTAYQVAASTLWKFGESDLAWLAAERGFRIAEALDDPLLLSNGARRLARGLMATGHHREAMRLIRADMDRLDGGLGRGNAAYLSIYGMLPLTGSVIAARLGDLQEASAFLADGERIAQRLGHDRNEHWTAFGPTNAVIHTVSVLVDFGEHGEAIAASKKLDPVALAKLPTERQTSLYIDLARAEHGRGRRQAALPLLLRAEQAAPQEIKARPVCCELIGELRRQWPGKPPETLVGLADRAGLPT